MSILALDPGPTETGWCVLRDGRVSESGVVDNVLLIGVMQRGLYRDCQLAIEMIASYGMAVGAEVFETCVWIGRFVQAWHTPQDVRRITRKAVKLHLCGTTKAKDPNVRQALIDKFGPGKELAIGKKAAPGPLYGIKSHAWSALAVAVTAHEVKA
jgi:hypothetical protein